MSEIGLYVLVGVVLLLQLMTWLKGSGGRKIARGSILLDTSAIMDGRLVQVAETGILTAELIVPRSVIREMQLLADKADSEKRSRARQGLENVKRLQKMETVAVTVVNDGYAEKGVDEQLLNLAKKYNAAIATVDYNLNKVAQTMDIAVINVNELAQVLRMNYLPGEQIEIVLTQAGQNRDQAVGYLEDGTMVVVADAKSQVGQKVKVEIVRALQTEAGRMMFAKKIPLARSGSKKLPTLSSSQSGVKKVAETVKKAAPARKTYRSSRKKRRTPEDSLMATVDQVEQN